MHIVSNPIRPGLSVADYPDYVRLSLNCLFLKMALYPPGLTSLAKPMYVIAI